MIFHDDKNVCFIFSLEVLYIAFKNMNQEKAVESHLYFLISLEQLFITYIIKTW